MASTSTGNSSEQPNSAPGNTSGKITFRQWLVILVAVIGFAFDIYELLMLPLVAAQGLSELLQVPINNPLISQWIGYITWSSAFAGGLFGLLGGWLIDRFGRKKVLILSILIYGFSPVCAAFSTSAWMLLVFRCTTFIGVCVEFVAAVAWLAELFPEPKRREWVLGITQAFSSLGGIMVTGMSALARQYASDFPSLGLDAPFNSHAPWRYTLISGLIPALPILLLLPFLPESPIWKEKRAKGTLKRPSLGEIFAPEWRRVTITSTILFACSYGIAFGAIQLTPSRISQGVPELESARETLKPLDGQAKALNKKFNSAETTDIEKKAIRAQLKGLAIKGKDAKSQIDQVREKMQFWQESAGLLGRIILAVLALLIVSRRVLLRIFLVPGLIITPLVFSQTVFEGEFQLRMGVAVVSLLTVAQFSYWGNYLPAAYPVHLRGTAGGFVANVGGRMIGTSASFISLNLIAPLFTSVSLEPHRVAYAAAIVGTFCFVVALVTSFFLPEPKADSIDS